MASIKDSSITNVVANDIERLLTEAPIEAVFLNGAKAYELFMKYCSAEGNHSSSHLHFLRPL